MKRNNIRFSFNVLPLPLKSPSFLFPSSTKATAEGGKLITQPGNDGERKKGKEIFSHSIASIIFWYA
jgi:hypothetical protein